MGKSKGSKASGKGATMGRHRVKCPHGYFMTSKSDHRCRAMRDRDGKGPSSDGRMDVKGARFGNGKQKNGSSSATRRIARKRRVNKRRRNKARGGPKAPSSVQPASDSQVISEAALSDQSTVRLEAGPVQDNRRPPSETDTGPQDLDSQSYASNIALLDGASVGQDYTNTTSLFDESPVSPDHRGPPSGYSKQEIETWRHATKVPDRPDWERLSVDRLPLPLRISSTDMITETAVAIHAARDSLALASRSPATASAIHETSTLLTRALALSLGVASGSVAMRNLPDLAQRLMDPAGEVDAVWEHLDPELAEVGLANLEGELEEAVGREVERLEAEGFEMRRDYEWGHFPGMGGVAAELRADEFREPRWDGEASHIPERDLALEADMWFEIWRERRERGEALGMWQMGEGQEWPVGDEV